MHVIEISEPELEEVTVVREKHLVGFINTTTSSFNQSEEIDQARVADENDEITEAKQTQRDATNKFRQEGESVECGKRQKMANYCTEFMDNSSLHGFKYLVGNDKSLIEKCFWFIVLSISTYLCATQIVSTYKNWQENPVFIGVTQNQVRKGTIPFPAVTVCPQCELNKESSYVFNNNKNEINASYFCDETSSNGNRSHFDEFCHHTGFTIKQIFEACCVRSNDCSYSQCERFSPIFTKHGVCFTINMIDKQDLFKNITCVPHEHVKHQSVEGGWDFDGPNPKIKKNESYPWSGSEKYLIYLHHPTEIPIPTSTSIELEMGKLYKVKIKPKVIISSEALRFYTPRRRQCFFTTESHLRFYKTYTYVNCKMECLSNYTLKQTGCVAYFMPSNATTPICPCVNHSTQKYERDIEEAELGISDEQNFKSCNCLPLCTSVTYMVDFQATNSSLPDDIIEVDMKIDEEEILSLERRELIADISFLANCGGLLGLFTGFSFISLFEIVYYLCFRWIYNMAKSYWPRNF